MSTADECKALGNEAFGARKFADAIGYYSKAIEMDGSNCVYYSNRSAAYLKAGELNKALVDADKCLELNPDFAKGYSRKGAALHALRRYNDAIAVYEEGLQRFPDDEASNLAAQLEIVRNDKELGSEKVRAMSKRASVVSKKKAAKAENMSEFVKFAKSNLELQIFMLQSQVKLLDSLAEMSDEDKLSLLFSLLDKDNDGAIDARELADAIRKRNEGMSFAEGLERAISFVALFDENKDAKLQPAEFKTFIDAMMKELDCDFHELSEFLILQLLFSDGGNNELEEFVGELAAEDINEAVKSTSEFYEALADERMIALYRLFDLDGDGTVDFKEVAVGLHKLTNDMKASAKAAVELLLLLDKDDQRCLDYPQFARLILNVVAAGDVKFDEVADFLTIMMCKPVIVTEEELAQLVVADAMYEMASDLIEAEKEASEVMDALEYGKMHKLFDLWDLNHDGCIDYTELLTGMRKYNDAMDIDESAARAAIVLLAFDEEGKQGLDRQDFALALCKYANALEVDLQDLVDFMCVTTVLKDDDVYEQAYIKAISPQATADIQMIQSELTVPGIE